MEIISEVDKKRTSSENSSFLFFIMDRGAREGRVGKGDTEVKPSRPHGRADHR